MKPLSFALSVALLFALPQSVRAQSLAETIDAEIEVALEATPAPAAGDEEFLRRVYLDLTGQIPSVAEAREFLSDPSGDKRTRLVDRLLESPEYARRMQHVFDVWLLERRDGNAIPAEQWQEYLRSSFEENKPFGQLAREILAADGMENRPAAKFYLVRGGEANALTRDVGRLFLGRDMTCAQCHDHPTIDGYKQRHYYGLSAFLTRGYVFTDSKAKKTYFAEKAEGEVSFKSVFDPEVDEKNFRPRLLDGPPLEEPNFAKGAEYYVKPDKTVRAVPKFSRRERLASLATDPDNAAFNENFANRLWAMMMGRGLTHPVGLHHPDNPPSHPKLQATLGERFAEMGYDVKEFLRQIASSQTYQRSSLIPRGLPDEALAPEKYAVANLKPLSAEQLAWSLLEAVGLCDAPRDAERNRLSADPRLAAIFEADAKRRYQRDKLVEEADYNKLKGQVGQFVSLYGGAEGAPEDEFDATVHQALFLSNGSTVLGWLGGGGPLVRRATKLEDPRAIADELYLAILTRYPSDDERLEAVEYLIRHADNPAAGVGEIAWALIASAEFRFNH